MEYYIVGKYKLTVVTAATPSDVATYLWGRRIEEYLVIKQKQPRPVVVEVPYPVFDFVGIVNACEIA